MKIVEFKFLNKSFSFINYKNTHELTPSIFLKLLKNRDCGIFIDPDFRDNGSKTRKRKPERILGKFDDMIHYMKVLSHLNPIITIHLTFNASEFGDSMNAAPYKLIPIVKENMNVKCYTEISIDKTMGKKSSGFSKSSKNQFRPKCNDLRALFFYKDLKTFRRRVVFTGHESISKKNYGFEDENQFKTMDFHKDFFKFFKKNMTLIDTHAGSYNLMEVAFKQSKNNYISLEKDEVLFQNGIDRLINLLKSEKNIKYSIKITNI